MHHLVHRIHDLVAGSPASSGNLGLKALATIEMDFFLGMGIVDGVLEMVILTFTE